MDTAGLITKELGIPRQYIKNYESRKDRILIAVHREWISQLLGSNEVPDFTPHETLANDEIQTLFYEKEEQTDWLNLMVLVVPKPSKNEIVIPLPKPRAVHFNSDVGLSYAQLLHYISETNFKNAWKHFYKKYAADRTQYRNKDLLKGNSVKKNNEILIDIINRFYGCKIISGSNYGSEYYSPGNKETDYKPHPNILPALCAVETKNCFLILYHVDQTTTLKDCITFTPTLLNSNYTKPLFVIYQLLQVMKNSHDRGLILGNMQLDEIFINNALFIQVIPNFQEYICKLSDIVSETQESVSDDRTARIELFQNYGRSCSIFPTFPPDSNLQSVCSKWINKEISNFDYLMYLNHVAGRRFGDPSCHFIMPWVTDFGTRASGAWRDLSKSKFRLNKGDRQLDLTYESAVNSSQIPHHVSDVLSEITYYVYLSRRTPRSLLCKYVRSVWVPEEYPSSIQRLQEWTPDECIPEFFYDTTIFKSIHEDLPDLELPPWALTPEEFIEAHRECLESRHVSERLHHWIDLTFGYKLSGSAAVKSKNVCLHLVESHRNLKTSGVVQLFSYPHPPRQFQVPYFDKVPPKTLFGCSSRQPKTCATHSEKAGGVSEDEGHSSGNGEDDSFGTKSSPLLFSKLINRSKGSLLASFQSSGDESSRSEPPKPASLSVQTSHSNPPINLPKDFVPSGLLTSVETNQNFFRKTFLARPISPSQETKRPGATLKHLVANKRIQEMQVLGCLIVELFLHPKIRVVDTRNVDRRLKVSLDLLGSDGLPRCVRPALVLLLQPFRDLQNYPYVTASGLPPPSAHQLLQPLLSSFAFPFPVLFPVIYSAVCNLVSCSKAVGKYFLREPRESPLVEALALLKVKKLSADLERVWEESLSVKNEHIVELLFPFLKELFDDPSTSRLSVILFLDKLCRSLGPNRTNDLLLDTILNLYNSNSYDASENLYLYHKNYLLVLIVRCGLKVFLENFIGPLMEAVGRYKDFSDEDWNENSCSDFHNTESDPEMNYTEEDFSPDVKAEDKQSGREAEAEMFVFDRDDCISNPDGEEAVRKAVEHLDLQAPSEGGDRHSREEEVSSEDYSGIKSVEINIPGYGSRQSIFNENEFGGGEKSFDSRESYQLPSKSGHQKKVFEKFEYGKDVDLSQIKASDVAGDSIVWLSHRLGPVLTSRHLIRNLLRVLSLCYTGKDSLEPHKFAEADEAKLWKLSILKWKVIGDENVETVLRVLGEISELYGEQIVLLQYLPFMSELINLSKRKFTLGLEGGIIGCLSLLKYIVPYMNDATLMDQLQDIILKSIIHPVVRLVSSTRVVFPSGQRGRYTLVSKLVDCLYLISLRIGAEMTKVHLAVPALQRFFLAFDKAHGVTEATSGEKETRPENTDDRGCWDESRYLEIQRDGTTTEWSVRGAPGEPISIAHVRSQESLDSSPCEQQDRNKTPNKALAELKSVFDAQLAHQCYGPFFRFLGETAMANALKNQNLIRDLYCRHEQEQALYHQTVESSNQNFASDAGCGQEKGCVGSFGSNVAVVGNKIEVQTVDFADSFAAGNAPMESDVLALICRKKRDYGRHLRGNWLAYWEHEIGRSEKDVKFNFKQIKLQSFSSHGNSVRMIYCLDNENSFISGSKDKTVKLWSLRSQGDGSSSNGCQFTYVHHRKSLLSLSFIHSVRLVASCDSTIHLWDPFEGKTVAVMDNPKMAPINVIRALNPPCCNFIAATTEATLKIIDTRLCSFVSEYKISVNSVGLVRSICVSPNGHWIAVGQASGLLTVLDVRTGMVLSSWKGHEAEVLQLAAVGDNALVSSSLDQTVSAWNVSDGKFKFHMKGPAEPVHCLAVYESELITGTTANRIGVHTAIDSRASFSSTKLRSDAFKGILTSMAVLPLNRLLLLGADNGNITLLC